MRQKTSVLISGLVAAGLLAACSSGEDVQQIPTSYVTPELPDPRNSLREVLALRDSGAASMTISLEEREVAGVVQLRARNGKYTSWLSSDNSLIVTQDGVVTATRGLGDDLMGSEVDAVVRAVGAQSPTSLTRQHKYLDGEDRIATRSFTCEVTSRGARSISFGGKSYATTLLQERCADAKDSFQNLYWMDRSGRGIVQSRQWISPEIGPMVTRRLK